MSPCWLARIGWFSVSVLLALPALADDGGVPECTADTDCSGVPLVDCEEAFCNGAGACETRPETSSPECGYIPTCTSDADCPARPRRVCEVGRCVAGECTFDDRPDGFACGPGTDCQRYECDAGTCGQVNEPDGTGCDDHDVCTTPDRCLGGECEGTWNPEGSGSPECMCSWPHMPGPAGSFSETDVVTGSITDLEVPLIDQVLCTFIGLPGGNIELEIARDSSGGELSHPDDMGLGYCTEHVEREESFGVEASLCGIGFFVSYEGSDSLTRTECAECAPWAEGAPRPEGMCLPATGCESYGHGRSIALGPLLSRDAEVMVGIPHTPFVLEASIEASISTGGVFSVDYDRSEDRGGPERDGVDCPTCDQCYSRVIDFGWTFGLELEGVGRIGIAEGRVKAEGNVSLLGRRRERRNVGTGPVFANWRGVDPRPEGACEAERCLTGSGTGTLDLSLRVGLASRTTLATGRGLGRGRFSGNLSFLHLSCEGEYARPDCDSEADGTWECTPRWTTDCSEPTCDDRGVFCGEVPSVCFDGLTINCGACPASGDPYNEKVCVAPRRRMPEEGVDRFSRACCLPRTCHDMSPTSAGGSTCVDPVPFDEAHFPGPGAGVDAAECGVYNDGCTDAWYEATLDCGECANVPSRGITNNSCGGGDQPYGRCGCTPDSAESVCAEGGGATCGTRFDGCGGEVECGACPDGQVCADNGRCCNRSFGTVCRWEPGAEGYPDQHVLLYPPRCGTVRRHRPGCLGAEFECGDPPDGFVCTDGLWACPGGGLDCVSDAYRCAQCAPTPAYPSGPPTYTHPITGHPILCRTSDC